MNKENRILMVLKQSKTKKTGFYTMNSFVYNSQLLEEKLNLRYFILYSVDQKNKLAHKFLSLFKGFYYSFGLLYTMFRYKPVMVYFTISPSIAFLRDFLFYIVIIKLFRCKLIYHIHGKGIRIKAHKNKINLAMYRWAYQGSYLIILSKKLLYDIEFLPFRQHFIVPNAIKPFYEFNPESKNFNEVPQILFLSNLIKSKGIFDFIDAIKILYNQGLNFKAIIGGSEGDVSVRELVKKISGLDKIQYIGFLNELNKQESLMASDILVFPTLYDIWGLVILEAMQAGLPVITTEEGAITDMIEDGVNGFIIEKKNPEQIVEKVLLLINNKELMKKMSDYTRKKFLTNYTIEKFEKNLNNIFSLILKDIENDI